MVSDPSQQPTPQWRRTEAGVVIAVFLYFVGTSFVTPFLPLYVIELDHVDVATAAIWSGAILGVAPLVSGFVAPLWGALSDRFGHKVLLQRSLIGFTICLGLLAVATSAWQLLLIRIGTGLVGGFSVAAQASVSVGAPRHVVMGAIGRVSAARVLGMAVGPLPGGILADTLGVRSACVISVVGGLVAFAVVTVLVAPVRRSAGSDDRSPAAVEPARGRSGMFALVASVATARLVEKSFDPVLPLFISSLVANPFGAGTTTALVGSSGLLAGALASGATGRVGGATPTARRARLAVLLLAAAAATVAVYLASRWWMVLALRIVGGGALGLAAALATAEAALVTPPSHRGRIMGVIGAGTAFGSAAGQLGAGLLSLVALPAVFLLDGALLTVSGGLVMLRRPRPPASS